MPKETFFNLPADKQSLICNIAMDEFAAYSFEQASINRMVKRAGIAKGSFYQYFKNKKDLFLYVLKQIGNEKMVYLAPAMKTAAQTDFFDLLRKLYLGGIRFAVEHPKYAEIGRKLLASKGTPIFNEVVSQNTDAILAFFEGLLRQAIQHDEVRADINIKLFVYLISEMNTLVLEYYTEHVSEKYDEGMMTTVEQFIEFLRFGIGVH